MLPSIDEFSNWLETLATQVDSLPPDSPQIAEIAKVWKHTDDFIAYLESDTTRNQFSYLRCKMMDLMISAVETLNKASLADPTPFLEQHDFETSLYICDGCGKDRVVIRLPETDKPVRAAYKCCHCEYGGIAVLTASSAAEIRSTGKRMDIELKKKKKKESEVKI